MEFNYCPLSVELRRDLAELKGVPVVRFPPEPSGQLHLGHLKALSLNYCIAKQYKGKFIVRFDDTNPSTESSEFEQGILEDIKKLGVVIDKLTATSDNFSEIMACAEVLLMSGDAYVDLTDVATMGDERDAGLESKFRNSKDSLALWQQMKLGDLTNGCVRLKINMKSTNKVMRDPAIYRCVAGKHHRTGTKFYVYPVYDWACPIVDSLEGITHTLRSSEFCDRDELYNWILGALKMRIPKMFHYGKLNVGGAIMSKRKIKELILSGECSSWSDPRLYTLRGMFNRGMTYAALDILMKDTGYTKGVIAVDPTTIWGINRKIINKRSARYCVVPEDSKVYELDLCEAQAVSKDIPKFKNEISLGMRKFFFDREIYLVTTEVETIPDNTEITLMNIGNAILVNNKLIPKFDGDVKKTAHKLLCVGKTNAAVITIISYDKSQMIKTKYIGEPAITSTLPGEFVQFMKMDYYMCVSSGTFIHVP
ncbi:MAG: glutamyl-tRNA synthetase [Harvfovirus sp.]|uniref:Glutamyl-tRNA synthetase n=1 Tax=Harvfovirus sp. TaxID=2487768 RepID=A0A3G5A1Y6_9VIRU|nr:MAG: glutamyl-tRNA synthetase [Harvfovirus sp.]